MILLPRLLPLLLLLTTLVPFANAAPPLDLLAPGDWGLSSPHPTDALLQTVSLADAPGGGAVLRITVTTPADPLWMIQILRGIPAAVPEGHRVQMHFWARSATKNPLRVTVEQRVSPYQGVAVNTFALTPAWQEYTVTGNSPGYGPNGLSAHFQVGQQAGVVEIAGATVTDQGVDPAIQPEASAARIEKYRKGDLTVTVTDAAGRPIPNAAVKVTQTRHAFLFGCNFFGLNPADTSPAQIAYQTEFTGLLNYATLPFYWGAFESQQGKPDYVRLQSMAEWCNAHGVTPKGHPLIWHEVWPDWAPKDPDEAIPLLKARVFDLIPRYKDTIHYWDVLNEANSAAEQQPANGESQWIKRDGPAPIVETALGWAREAGKGLPETFTYNDYDTGDANLGLLAKLQTDGKLPDAIGIQSHMHTGEWPMSRVWQVCEAFRKFGKPIHFTETTVISGPRRVFDYNGAGLTDWLTTPEGEAKQANYVAQFYTLLFSHPSVRAITWWDFSDSDAWLGAPAGLIRKDMTPKPAYTRLMDLIHKQWWTNGSGKTDRRGAYKSRVFYGDYTITVTDAKGRTKTQNATFPEAAPPLAVTLRLP